MITVNDEILAPELAQVGETGAHTKVDSIGLTYTDYRWRGEPVTMDEYFWRLNIEYANERQYVMATQRRTADYIRRLYR